MFTIIFETATITRCDFIGRTRYGVAAVVLQNGVKVFTSKAHAKRITGRREAEAFIQKILGWERG